MQVSALRPILKKPGTHIMSPHSTTIATPRTAEIRVVSPSDGSLSAGERAQVVPVLRIYSHSPFYFWWPVWVTGFVMALLTYWYGRPPHVEGIPGQPGEWVHPSSNLAVIFLLMLYLVVLITSFTLRGLASGMVILATVLVTVVLAWVGWWDDIFRWFGNLTVHLTLGAYFWFSTLMCLTWFLSVFGFDRLSYWEFTPGQLTRKTLFGSGSHSYNTQGMALEKHRDDIFRHWLIGLGSGDLKLRTSGATREEIDVPNVLFIGSKVAAMQRFIAEVPEGENEV
jgi:hypothetical protein